MTDLLKHAIAEGRLLIVYWEDWSKIDGEGDPELKKKILTCKGSGITPSPISVNGHKGVVFHGKQWSCFHPITPCEIETYGIKVADENEAKELRDKFEADSRARAEFLKENKDVLLELTEIVARELV